MSEVLSTADNYYGRALSVEPELGQRVEQLEERFAEIFGKG